MKTGSNGKIKRRFKRRRRGGLRGWLWGSLECRLRSPSYLILQFLKNNTVMDYGVVCVVRVAQRRLVRSHVAARLPSLLLFASSRQFCRSCLRRPGGTKVTRLIARHVVARPPATVLVRVVRAAQRSLVQSCAACPPATALVHVVRAAQRRLV